MKHPSDVCRCGHPRHMHHHGGYRPGTDCGKCGHTKCPKFRRAWRVDRLLAEPLEPPAPGVRPAGYPRPAPGAGPILRAAAGWADGTVTRTNALCPDQDNPCVAIHVPGCQFTIVPCPEHQFNLHEWEARLP